MALTKSEQLAWHKNKEYWVNRLILQDEIDEKDIKKIEKELMRLMKN